MKMRFLFTPVLILAIVAQSLALQNPSPQSSQPAPSPQSSPNPQSQDEKSQPATPKPNNVVKIGVTLMQVDVTVTDKKGKPVGDLRAEDFEVLQNNRPQHITNFSYVTPSPAASSLEAAKAHDKKTAAEPPAPPAHLKPENIRRTIALVVDDLTLSFESTAAVRQALKKYVDEQMQPGDLVAILRTAAGMGALQQFTNDKRLLYAAIERVRWSPSHGTLYTFAPVAFDPSGATRQSSTPTIPTRGPSPKKGNIETDVPSPSDILDSTKANDPGFDFSGTFGTHGALTDQVDPFRQEVFAIGTLGALGFVVRGLRQLPGRKSVVLFSDSLRIYDREQNITRVQGALDNLTDLANRAAVSFYTVDARGLQTLSMTAQDDLGGTGDALTMGEVQETSNKPFLGSLHKGMTDRRRDFFESQEGLRDLAARTGGEFVGNNNDLNRGVERALQDQGSYYLIGFVPDEATFKAKDGSRELQNIAVRVKREGLRVRTRTGFYGITNEEDRRLAGSAAQQLLMALASPFGASDIRVKMTTQFWHDAKKGAFINALLHIDARDLAFEDLVNGWRKTTFEVAAFTFGDNGRVIDQSDRAYSVSMNAADYTRTLERGIFYRISLPIKKPGAYQLRTAARDRTSKKVGAANQFIEVPDLKKTPLALSGIIVRGESLPSANQPEPTTAGEQTASNREGRVEEIDAQANPVVRRFRRNQVFEYGYLIYNAALDKATRRPLLETQLRLYCDGHKVFDGRVKSLETTRQPDLARLVAGGTLRLGNELAPGDYDLQVIIRDLANKDKPRLATQWIDFEIIK
jgi:VWFA-related protein